MMRRWNYYWSVTKELDRAIQTLEMAVQNYPREGNFWLNLGVDYSTSGRHEDALQAELEAVRLGPARTQVRNNLASTYQNLGQFAEAFAENGVDLDLLPAITNDDLKDLGVARLADRKRILSAIAQLDKDTSSEPSTKPDQSEVVSPTMTAGTTIGATGR